MNQSFLSSKSEVFQRAGLSLEQINYWNEVQSRFNSYGFVFVEYGYDVTQHFIWRCYLEQKTSDEAPIAIKSILFDGEALNTHLAIQFADQESYSNQYWEAFMKKVRWSGFFIPVDDFSFFTNPQMASEINHGFLLCQHFKVSEYLDTLKKDTIDSDFKKDPMAILGIWYYLVFYANFLYSCFADDEIKEKPNVNWHTRNVSLKNFHAYLPSRQISTLLFITVELGFVTSANSSKIERLLKYSHQEVQNFFAKHATSIALWINEKKGVLFDEEMKIDFVNCCREDIKIITALEIVNSSNFEYFKGNQSPHLLNRIYKKESNSFFAKIRASLSRISLTDLLWYDPTAYAVQPKRYMPPATLFYNYSISNWYEMENAVIEEITEETQKFPTDIKTKFTELVLNKWSHHLINVSNTFCPPIFIWKLIDAKTIPQWNLFDNNTAKNLYTIFCKKQENLSDQQKRYRENVLDLQKLRSINAIENYVTKVDHFFDPIIKRKWEQKVEQHSRSVKGMHIYRERRMLELGISEQGSIDFRTEIWLDEMLKIEDEIRNYIPFVKKAFNAALPIRKTIAFDNDRHDVSGIEFDSTTITDQNKWLRGEVMKTMKSNIRKGEIEQINAFCLDFSGSMDHDRMRNLFKILYLLVLGLEDRKSYDAFHFFNISFLEGSNFTEKFTQRSLLFKILSTVSEISNGAIIYGGFNGTNIGDGIVECHKRIHSFKQKIILKNPDSKFVCSMFVITDGEPSIGIIDLDELNELIQEKRDDGEIAIKGIYIKSKEDENNFMEAIFGKNEFVETVEFSEAVNKFVAIMTHTYQEQRKAQKRKTKQKLLKGSN